jgi:hypothetical protein
MEMPKKYRFVQVMVWSHMSSNPPRNCSNHGYQQVHPIHENQFGRMDAVGDHVINHERCLAAGAQTRNGVQYSRDHTSFSGLFS